MFVLEGVPLFMHILLGLSFMVLVVWWTLACGSMPLHMILGCPFLGGCYNNKVDLLAHIYMVFLEE